MTNSTAGNPSRIGANFVMKWTKISDGCYQLNETSYHAVKDEHADGTRWWVCYEDQIIDGMSSEPSRQFAGYAIQARIKADEQGIATSMLKLQIQRTKQTLNSLLEAWHEYEEAYGGIQAPVENYPFEHSLDEVAYAALAMELVEPTKESR